MSPRWVYGFPDVEKGTAKFCSDIFVLRRANTTNIGPAKDFFWTLGSIPFVFL
jgi:hypothetical protein